MPRRVLSVAEAASFGEAARILRGGGLVAFPTETVYGLGADAANAQAVCRIFEVKKRPAFDPLIIHAIDAEQAFSLCRHVPAEARMLAKAFWPGPLTLVLPKHGSVLDLVTSGLDTVAVRVPKHETAQNLLRAFGAPIAAPSANLFGYTSPTSAKHVAEDLGEKIDLILDGGACPVGVESTVLALNGGRGRILRPGAVTAQEISKFVTLSDAPTITTGSGKPEAPGQMESHYAPWTKLYLLPGTFASFADDWKAAEADYVSRKGVPPRAGLLAYQKCGAHAEIETVVTLSDKGDVTEAASNLFEAIRKLDKMNLDLILAEPPVLSGIGLAIADRLEKASSGLRASRSMFNGL